METPGTPKTGRVERLLHRFGIGTAYPTIEDTTTKIEAERLAREEKFDLDNLKSFLDGSGSSTYAARTEQGARKVQVEIRPTSDVLHSESRTDFDGAHVTDTTLRCDRHGYFVLRQKNIKEPDGQERVLGYFERFDKRHYDEWFGSK